MQRGFKVYHGPFQNILGWILQLFKKAVLTCCNDSHVYFNCVEFREYLKRVDGRNLDDAIFKVHSHAWILIYSRNLVREARERLGDILIEEPVPLQFVLRP